MPPTSPIDADEVHVVDAAAARGSRAGMLAILVVLLAVAGAGAWVWLEEPFAGQAASELPPPAPGNLLGHAWSFETDENGSPLEAWTTDEGAPSGFSFGAAGAHSGVAAAEARPGDAGWAAMVSKQSWRLEGKASQVELSGQANGAGVQLLARFVGPGLPTLDAVAASGSGALVGRVTAPPGYERVAFLVVSVGTGSVDDLGLELHAGAGSAARHVGVYEVFAGDPPGLTVVRGQDVVLRVEPASVRPAEGRYLPGRYAQLPSSEELVLADGRSLSQRTSVTESGTSLTLSCALDGAPEGSRLVREVTLTGGLAREPVGVRSTRGYERFTSDFDMQGVDALILGRTQDRLQLSAEAAFDLSVVHRPDGSVGLLLSQPAGARVASELTMQGSFQAERLAAADLRDAARAAEQAGRLGEALQALQQILTRYPFDEQVLEHATSTRARLELEMQRRLDSLAENLGDALFLGSAQRCKEVRAEAERLAAQYAGNDAADLFREMAGRVDAEAASLLAEEEGRRRQRVVALLDSFREQGSYQAMEAEFAEYLARHFAADEDGR